MSDASARLRRRPRAESDVRLPDELETARSKLVYLALAVAGEESEARRDSREGTTVDELGRRLGLSKLTLLPVLRSLRDRGLVERTDRGYAVDTDAHAGVPETSRDDLESAGPVRNREHGDDGRGRSP